MKKNKNKQILLVRLTFGNWCEVTFIFKNKIQNQLHYGIQYVQRNSEQNLASGALQALIVNYNYVNSCIHWSWIEQTATPGIWHTFAINHFTKYQNVLLICYKVRPQELIRIPKYPTILSLVWLTPAGNLVMAMMLPCEWGAGLSSYTSCCFSLIRSTLGSCYSIHSEFHTHICTNTFLSYHCPLYWSCITSALWNYNKHLYHCESLFSLLPYTYHWYCGLC